MALGRDARVARSHRAVQAQGLRAHHRRIRPSRRHVGWAKARSAVPTRVAIHGRPPIHGTRGQSRVPRPCPPYEESSGMTHVLTRHELEFLRLIDTPTVCNLIEIAAPER